jgi:Ca-activated chloride channel family protein
VPLGEIAANVSRDICLLLDCSGSMLGDAIVQSRAALSAVAEALQEHDRIQVIRFGSSTSALFRRPLQATWRHRNARG